MTSRELFYTVAVESGFDIIDDADLLEQVWTEMGYLLMNRGNGYTDIEIRVGDLFKLSYLVTKFGYRVKVTTWDEERKSKKFDQLKEKQISINIVKTSSC